MTFRDKQRSNTFFFPLQRLSSGVLMYFVDCYQYFASGRPTVCRYVPSCSNYALDAIEGHGAFRGLLLTLCRLLRCNPWGGKGWDPVPTPVAKRQSDRSVHV